MSETATINVNNGRFTLTLRGVEISGPVEVQHLIQARLVEDEGKWLPIESAPNNWDVLVWGKFNSIRVLRLDGGEWLNEDDVVFTAPTHWLPLPPPPQEGK